MIGLLKANLTMMKQVIASHEMPGTVSFSSLRKVEKEFDAIKSKATIG